MCFDVLSIKRQKEKAGNAEGAHLAAKSTVCGSGSRRWQEGERVRREGGERGGGGEEEEA